jgi:hypothetical protein
MIAPLWGTYCVERWLNLCFASLRSEGNIPYLNETCDVTLLISIYRLTAQFGLSIFDSWYIIIGDSDIDRVKL